MNHHRIMGDKNPKEVFIGVNSEIGHLSIFGFPIYIHVPIENRTKMDLLQEKDMFVGYNETYKYYRIFLQVKRNKVVRRYVKFNENLSSRKSHELPRVAEDEEWESPKGENN
jgi:hypothetical protein